MTLPLLARLAIAAAVVVAASGASANSLVAQVDLSRQELVVLYRGEALAAWPVSTGRAGFRTQAGTFRPQRMYREYYSKQYHGSPMPNAIFYDGGYAIHGSYEVASLGRPASHGCIRLHPADAEKLFELVLTVGSHNTAIRVKP